jgi:membrane-associated phospholipid phosphatase
MSKMTVRMAETAGLRRLRPDTSWSTAMATSASEMSRGGGIWLALTVAAALRPGSRSAGRDGMLAWVAASMVAFGLKRQVQRPRPKLVHRIGSPPTSSSMPSSQTAGAVAYATAAVWRSPTTGLITMPLAITVAWSRAATGRHFPTDIAAGAALGLAAGTLVHLALRRRQETPSADD